MRNKVSTKKRSPAYTWRFSRGHRARHSIARDNPETFSKAVLNCLRQKQ